MLPQAGSLAGLSHHACQFHTLLPHGCLQDIVYTKLECVGRGGSSKVYKVMAPNRKIFALKRIRLQVGRAWGVCSSCWLLPIQSAEKGG